MPARLRTAALGAAIAALAAFALVAVRPDSTANARGCPPGFESVTQGELAAEFGGGGEAAEAEARSAGGDGARFCLNAKHPETFAEIEGLGAEWSAKALAPWTSVDAEAFPAALQERAEIEASAPQVRGSGNRWRPYGRGPLISNDPRFPSVNGTGLVELAGRVDSLDYDPVGKRLFATIGTGGVWMSQDLGRSWRSIGESLPSQILGAVAWTPARGGRLLVVSGEHLQGGNTFTGIGAFWSDDLGKTWHISEGVPSGILGFQVAVDHSNPSVAYVATSKGLFRTANAGASYVNVNLPTGECAGQTDNQRCLLANYVTDVVVQSPDGFGNTGGAVLAAVGYRAGNRPYPQDPDTIEAPYNGLYRSDNGAQNSFTKLAASGFAPQYRIGRLELGIADGPQQNHDYVYAVLQDAELFRGGARAIDAPDTFNPAGTGTSFGGIFVTGNFGDSWTQIATTDQIAHNPSTGSGLAAVSAINPPGIQAWYNEWIKVDPTRQVNGIPTRVTFGLEEVWQNRTTNVPLIAPTEWQVIGRYFSSESCIIGISGVPTCPPNANPLAPTTTHPDQHDAIFIPDGQGGVTLLAGNDGGVYGQHVGTGQEFSNQRWGIGLNRGFNTLLPYDARMARDGTVWYGLQDNGTGKIEGASQRQFMTFGGDGTFVMVDPNNSAVAYSATPGLSMRVTKDGGTTWRDMYPFVSGAKFVNPFVMDPTDANHLMTGGRQIVESTYGPETQQMDPGGNECLENCWETVFDLGTKGHPGDEDAGSDPLDPDPDNTLSALDLQGDNAYVGYCGPCGLLNATTGFQSGIATNVGGAAPPKRMTPDGWHIAAANGLPERYVNWVTVDPANPRTVYVALGGYENRQWRPPGSYGDPNQQIGRGHVFVSHDAGENFTNISANLPDAPAFAVELWRNQVVVATQAGTFISSNVGGAQKRPKKFQYASLNGGLPVVPIVSMSFAPQDRDLLVAATYGRGVYTIDLGGCGGKAARRPGTQIVGTAAKDRLRGTKGKDVICGKQSSDRLSGKKGKDLLIGGGGKKTKDRLSGGGGNDLLRGQGGKDVLKGGAGRDRLIGGGGRDVCVLGKGDVGKGCERRTGPGAKTKPKGKKDKGKKG